MKKSILSLLLIVSISCADFIRDNANNIVTDIFTNLQWQDDAAVTSTIKNWQDAIDYCETLSLGGHSDWHLPSKNELQSIIDSSMHNPAISSVFQNRSSYYYWSSTTVASTSIYSWGVFIENGAGSWGDKTYDGYVRCVR